MLARRRQKLFRRMRKTHRAASERMGGLPGRSRDRSAAGAGITRRAASPRIFSRETLVGRGYPGEGTQPYYLVYDIAPLPGNDPLRGYEWDLSKVDDIADGRSSPIPGKGIPLNVLMKAAKKKPKV